MWRAIWNGPFYIGKLERPVSVGDAIMKVLETLWRGCLVAATGFGLLVGAMFYSSWVEGRARAEAVAATRIVVRADFRGCPAGYPIRATLTNNGRKALSYVSYDIVITDPALDRNVAPSEFSTLSYSDGIEPGNRLERCLSPFWDYGTPTGLVLRSDLILSGSIEFASTN